YGCSTAVSPAEEVRTLAESGNWLEALSAGRIRPVTPEQEHFLAVDRDEAEPATVAERAGGRLKGRREYGRGAGGAPPPGRDASLRHGRVGRRRLLVVGPPAVRVRAGAPHAAQVPAVRQRLPRRRHGPPRPGRRDGPASRSVGGRPGQP